LLVLAELLALRDPGSEPAAHLPECVLGPEAGPSYQRHERDGDGRGDRGGLDPSFLDLLDGAGQLGRDPQGTSQHADEDARFGGHRHPPEAPVKPGRLSEA